MLKFFLLILMTTAVKLSLASTVIVSGLDDVIRQANNKNIFSATLRMFKNDQTYAGMPELYQAIMKAGEGRDIKIISGMPKIFEDRIIKFLSHHPYPPYKIYLRNILYNPGVASFKMEKIKEIVRENPTSLMLIILDNSSDSHEFAERLRSEYGPKIGKIYHREENFFTAFDIAYSEYLAGRLSALSVEKIGLAILNQKNRKLILPDYGVCPMNHEACPNETGLIKKICSDMNQWVQTICKERK